MRMLTVQTLGKSGKIVQTYYYHHHLKSLENSVIDITFCNHFAYHHYKFQAEFAELSTTEIIFLLPEKVKDSCQQYGHHEKGRTLKE